MTPQAYQINYDGLPGPTHNFGGLGSGNIPSMENAMGRSRPRDAALQALYKMKQLSDMGIKQAILPPQERPDLRILRRVGFSGSDAQILEAAYRHAPDLLVACSSSSSAWAANAASVTGSLDAADKRVHITPANLMSQFHRSLETETTQLLLYALFPDPDVFVHHDPLPSHESFGDEGQANQLHLSATPGGPGVTLMAWGRRAFGAKPQAPRRFIPRQTLEAAQSIARLHRLPDERLVFAEQNPEAIDAGVFHNDIIALAHQNLLIYHERAWLNHEEVVKELRVKLARSCNVDLHVIRIADHELHLSDLIASYLLNSELITLSTGRMALIAPLQARDNPHSLRFIERLLAEDNPVDNVYYFDIGESMKNGGGIRCGRLSVSLTASELKGAFDGVFLSPGLYKALIDWVLSHYREELLPGDIRDPKLLLESRTALDELTDLLDLGPVYPFQQE